MLDNRQNGNVANELKNSINSNTKLSIISAYFTIYAYKELEKELKKQGSYLQNLLQYRLIKGVRKQDI